MNVNVIMAELLPYMFKAKECAINGDYSQADNYIRNYVDGCIQCYHEINTRDGQRVAIIGYTHGAVFYAELFSNNSDAYSFSRHECARSWADEGIRLSYQILCDDRDNGRSYGNSALYLVGAVKAGLCFGMSDCVKKYMQHSDILIEKLVKNNPQNKELDLVYKTYNEVREKANYYENIYQSEKRKKIEIRECTENKE